MSRTNVLRDRELELTSIHRSVLDRNILLNIRGNRLTDTRDSKRVTIRELGQPTDPLGSHKLVEQNILELIAPEFRPNQMIADITSRESHY
jgi:hypothetical protein